MNIPLLQKVRAAILKNPTQFNMDWWFQQVSSKGKRPKGCGTAACIAGWALAIDGKHKKLTTAKKQYNEVLEIEEAAANALGISGDQAERLFGQAYWPTPLDVAYDKAKTDKQAAEVAAERIDLFIETKGAK